MDFSDWGENALLVLESGRNDMTFKEKQILWYPVKIKEFSKTTTVYFLRKKPINPLIA